MRNFDDLWGLEDGEVLVTPATGESFNSFLHFVGAIVTDHGSFASHAAIMGREMGFPTVVGCVDATRRIATGTPVRVDGTAGNGHHVLTTGVFHAHLVGCCRSLVDARVMVGGLNL